MAPVAWLHYYDLLLVPLALWRPRFWVWLIPLLLVLAPGQGNGALWQTGGTLLVAAATLVLARTLGASRVRPVGSLVVSPG